VAQFQGGWDELLSVCSHVGWPAYEANLKTYTPEELNKLAMEIARQPVLYVPLREELPPTPAQTTGPAVCVYLKYSEIVPGAGNTSELYWSALKQTPVIAGVGLLATINCLLSEHRSADAAIHRMLQERFLTPDLAAKVAAKTIGGPGFTGVFTRTGCLQVMQHLLLYGDRSVKAQERNDREVGALLLLANEFFQFDQVQNLVQPETLDLLLSFLPVWDIYNPRDLAYAVSRTFQILTEVLPGNDPEVCKLASKLGMNTKNIRVGNLPLNDFVAAVFGLFAYGRSLKGAELAVFDVRRIFSKVGFPAGVLRKLVNDRALSASALRKRLGAGKLGTRAGFYGELARRSFLSDSLNIFRQYPLMKMDSNRVLILDLEFLAELLTAGVYWNIFDNLPSNQRETFRELWGRLFELYSVELLRQFYPQLSGILIADLTYDDGQVDALLDFGTEVVVFEIKSSLLTEGAKRGGNKADFIADYARKFVRNAKGKPKALAQLGAACTAIENGKIATAMRPARIFPVCISDEPAVESFFFTSYSNELFQKEVAGASTIQPVTMMSVNELEEILPYVAENAFSWADLLEFRSRHLGGAFSVHQAIYDLKRQDNIPVRRNPAVRKSFDDVWRIIRARYKRRSAGLATTIRC
jgi:hypothetical protein